MTQRNSDCFSERMLRLELPRKRPGGKPKRRVHGCSEGRVVGISKEDAEKKIRWR